MRLIVRPSLPSPLTNVPQTSCNLNCSSIYLFCSYLLNNRCLTPRCHCPRPRCPKLYQVNLHFTLRGYRAHCCHSWKVFIILSILQQDSFFCTLSGNVFRFVRQSKQTKTVSVSTSSVQICRRSERVIDLFALILLFLTAELG